MPPTFFDLIYVITPEGSTMACGVVVNGDVSIIGPFPAKEAGPKIVDAIFGIEALGFKIRKEAEIAYISAHFGNMARGENAAGQAYPIRTG